MRSDIFGYIGPAGTQGTDRLEGRETARFPAEGVAIPGACACRAGRERDGCAARVGDGEIMRKGVGTAMSDISAINDSTSVPVGRAEPLLRIPRPVEVPVRRDADRVEVSREAREAARAEPIRRDLVERIRLEIDAGTYDTPERLEIAADHLLIKGLNTTA